MSRKEDVEGELTEPLLESLADVESVLSIAQAQKEKKSPDLSAFLKDIAPGCSSPILRHQMHTLGEITDRLQSKSRELRQVVSHLFADQLGRECAVE